MDGLLRALRNWIIPAPVAGFPEAERQPPRQDSESQDRESSKDRSYSPSVADVLNVKQLIFRRSGLPLELIDSIIDYAEYWPQTTMSMMQSPAQIRNGNIFLVRYSP